MYKNLKLIIALLLIILGTWNGKNKEILVDLTNIKAEGSQQKRKAQPASNRNSKKCKIIEHNSENYDFNAREREIAIKEHELQVRAQEAATRKALAEAEALELINLEKKKSLRLL